MSPKVGNKCARRRGPTDGETPGWASASARAKQLQAAACGGADAPLPVELPHTTKLRRHPHAGGLSTDQMARGGDMSCDCSTRRWHEVAVRQGAIDRLIDICSLYPAQAGWTQQHGGAAAIALSASSRLPVVPP